MDTRSPTDDHVMTLVEEALRRPEDEREGFLRRACGPNEKLLASAWSYVQWEKRMQRFLLDPMQPPPAGRTPFAPGELLIKRFRIIREVAQGGMGIVWEAIDEKLDRRVALKCAKAGFGKQLPPEVRNAREISHPNVCKIFEIHTASTADGEIDFISMEFLEGETLAERIRHGALPESKARTVARQLCAGLAEAHHNHLIHGDLKANNVILTVDSDGAVRAVITDFGLARQAETSARILGGTPAYMAPELWKGDKASVASDIYALGVMLWELRSGRTPSDLGVASSTLLLGEQVSWKPPTGRGKWDRIIARCLDPDPARRFGSATEVAEAFGPSYALRWVLAVAAMLGLAAGSGLITYERATAPAETVRLALLPLASTPDDDSISGNLLRNTANQLAALKSTRHTRFRFISLDNVIRNRVNTGDEARVLLGASHSLRATVERRGDLITVHGYLTDVRSGVDAQEWKAEYKTGEMRYAPTALAGFVTESLHLPPPIGGASVNVAARKDYLAGLEELRRYEDGGVALGTFGRAVKADPDSALTWAGLAEAQWSQYSVGQGEVWLQREAASEKQAENRNPDAPQVHRIAGGLQAKAGRYERAITEYLRAIELDATNDTAYRRLGLAYEENSQLDLAKAAFQKAVEIGPLQARNFQDLGGFYYNRAAHGDAVKYFKRAVELAPSEWDTHYALGISYLSLGQYNLAERELRSSTRLHEIYGAVESLGVALMCQGKDRDAIPELRRALNLEPKQYLTWMMLGTACRRIGEAATSKEAYQRGLDLAEAELTNNPRSGVTRAYFAYLCAQLGDRRRAATEIEQALQESPDDGTTRWTAAVTYEALDRREDTLTVLARSPAGVLREVSRWPDVADLLGDPRYQKMLASTR